MEKDLIYTPEITTIECFSCKEIFKLYSIQKNNGLNLCKLCTTNYKLTELVALFTIVKTIVEFAEKQNKKLDGRLIVDVADLINELQEGQ